MSRTGFTRADPAADGSPLKEGKEELSLPTCAASDDSKVQSAATANSKRG